MSVCELEQESVNLESLADEWFELDSMSFTEEQLLADLKERHTGKPFAGIDDTGTWLIALFCGESVTPTPWFLTVLQPC